MQTDTTSARPDAAVRNVRPVRSRADHAWALQEVDRYFADEPDMGSPDGDRFEVLLTLIAAYEETYHPIEPADPVEILHFAIQDVGRSQAELSALLGSRARASEILNRKRHLSLAQIRAISEGWHLPIAPLAAPYRLERDAG